MMLYTAVDFRLDRAGKPDLIYNIIHSEALGLGQKYTACMG